MYNKRVKEEYISIEKKNGVTVENTLRNKFERFSKYEEKLGKDLCNFSYNECMQFYKQLYSNSITTLNANNSMIKRYTKWCLANGLVEDDQNHWDEVSLDALSNCINAGLMDESMITREELEDVIRDSSAMSLQNVSDKFLILATFEGFKIGDLFNLRAEDIQKEKLVYENGREIVPSKMLVNLGIESAEEYRRFNEDGSEAVRSPYNKNDDRIVKTKSKALDDVERYKHNIRCRFANMQEKYGEIFNRAKIAESGRIDMIKRLMNGEKVDDLHKFIQKNREKIEKMYGEFYSVKRWLQQYGKYLEA